MLMLKLLTRSVALGGRGLLQRRRSCLRRANDCKQRTIKSAETTTTTTTTTTAAAAAAASTALAKQQSQEMQLAAVYKYRPLRHTS